MAEPEKICPLITTSSLEAVCRTNCEWRLGDEDTGKKCAIPVLAKGVLSLDTKDKKHPRATT